MIARSKRMICCWAMGLTQHRDAVATIRMLVNLLLLGGHIGRPGAGTCCVRGHSNVQGDRTMGIWERPTGPFLDALEREFDFAPPRKAGHDTVDTITAMHDGEIEVFVALGGNFLSAAPDTVCTAEALRRCRLTVHIATKLNRSHLVTGRQALLLPCLGRSERDPGGFLTVEDAMGVISSSTGRLEPASADLRSEAAIIAGIATATIGDRSRIDWEGLAGDYGRIRDHVARVVPGFDDFNARIARGPFYLPNPARERRFVTSSGKAHFAVAPIFGARVGRGSVHHDDDPQPRPVQHDDLRPPRPLPRRARRAAGAVHQSGGRGGPWMDGGNAGGHHQSLRRRAQACAIVSAGALSDSAALRRRATSPRRTCSCRSAAWRRRATHPRPSRFT